MHAQVGTPGAVIQASVGHANPSMTAHYTHVNEATARDVAAALPAFAGKGEALLPVLPDWAVEALEAMNTRNWRRIRKQMLGKRRTGRV